MICVDTVDQYLCVDTVDHCFCDGTVVQCLYVGTDDWCFCGCFDAYLVHYDVGMYLQN